MRYKNKDKKFNIDDVVVVTTVVLHTWNPKDTPVETRVYFLATEYEGKYYELFTDIEIESVKFDKDGCAEFLLDQPYAFERTPLSNFLADNGEKTISNKDLLRLITSINIEIGMQVMSNGTEETECE